MRLYLNGQEFGVLNDGKYHSYRDSMISDDSCAWSYVDPYRNGRLAKYRKGPCNQQEAANNAEGLILFSHGTWVIQ